MSPVLGRLYLPPPSNRSETGLAGHGTHPRPASEVIRLVRPSPGRGGYRPGRLARHGIEGWGLKAVHPTPAQRRAKALAAGMLCALALLGASPAGAAEFDEATQALLTDGFYVEAGTGSASGLSALVAGTDGDIGLASFADDLGDATLVAEDLSGRSGVPTVIVLTPVEIGVFSTRYSDAELTQAIDASLDAFDASLATGYEAFVGALPSGAAPTTPTTAGPTEEPSGGVPVGTIILVVIVGGAGVLWWRSRSKAKATEEARIAEAKREVDAQIATVSNEILELSDRVMVSDGTDARDRFQHATALFADAQAKLDGARSVVALEDLSDDLDEIRYQLDATDALLVGRPVPEKPEVERVRCFFDPSHPQATEIATLKTPAGERQVSVCEADAEKLRRGERPDWRGIEVDGRRMPAPQAPRSYGGGGLDWLDVFSVIVGGSNAIDFDLGSRRPVRQRRTVYAPRPRAATRRTVVPSPRSRSSSGHAGRRRAAGRASRSRGSHRAGGKARRRR